MSRTDIISREEPVNDTTFFEWDPITHGKYFEKVVTTGELTIPSSMKCPMSRWKSQGCPTPPLSRTRQRKATRPVNPLFCAAMFAHG